MAHTPAGTGRRAKRPDTCAVCGMTDADAQELGGHPVDHAFVSAAGLKRTVKPEAAHAVYSDYASGWTWYVLKLYQTIDKGRRDPYARAFCKVVSPMTGESGDLGDTYIRDIGGRLVRGIEVR